MESILSLWVSIVMASCVIATTAVISSPDQELDQCDCPSNCSLHGSNENDTVKVYRSTSDNNKIFCLSPENMKVVFRYFSLADSLERYTNVSTFPPNDPTNKQQFFCLRLTVVQWHSSLYVQCKTISNKEESGFYKLDIGFELLSIPSPTPKISNSTKTNSTDTTTDHVTSVPSTAINSTKNQTKRIDALDSHRKVEAGSPPIMDRTTIIAVTGGGAAFMVLLVVLVILLMRKVTRQQKALDMTNEEIDEFMLGVAAEKANAKGLNGLFVLPYDTRLEIPKSEVIFRSTILGSGAFGQVVKGTYQGSQVAIKMLKNNASQNAEYLRSLLGELKVMSYLGSHANLVTLIGAITANIKAGQVYLLFEFCLNGNVHKYVRDHRESFVDLLAGPAPSNLSGARRTTRFSVRRMTRLSMFDVGSPHSASLTTKDLVRWAYEVASGMEYVCAKNVYHGDLAARNILLTENLTAKVGDFGLSKQLDVEKYNCYVQKKECPLPLKWMAIESLRDLTFSIQSDVWSYGVTLWEIFTLGTTPYPGMDWNFESWKLLCEGRRLDKPDYATHSIYNIMMSCWDANPKARPGFCQLRDLMYGELQKF